MTMGEKIKSLRKKIGLTQEELGKRMTPQVNRAAVNKWETGQVENIKRSYIEQLSELFNISPSELMCFESSDPDEQLAFALWGNDPNITAEDIADVRRFAEFLRQKKGNGNDNK